MPWILVASGIFLWTGTKKGILLLHPEMQTPGTHVLKKAVLCLWGFSVVCVSLSLHAFGRSWKRQPPRGGQSWHAPKLAQGSWNNLI